MHKYFLATPFILTNTNKVTRLSLNQVDSYQSMKIAMRFYLFFPVTFTDRIMF